jgi:hypothetical protein
MDAGGSVVVPAQYRRFSCGRVVVFSGEYLVAAA